MSMNRSDTREHRDDPRGARRTERGRELTEQPLGSTRDRESVMPGPRREDVRHVHPPVYTMRSSSVLLDMLANCEVRSLRQGSAANGVEAHVEVEHGGHGLACWRRVHGVLGRREGLEERADDKERDAHAHSGDEER